LPIYKRIGWNKRIHGSYSPFSRKLDNFDLGTRALSKHEKKKEKKKEKRKEKIKNKNCTKLLVVHVRGRVDLVRKSGDVDLKARLDRLENFRILLR